MAGAFRAALCGLVVFALLGATCNPVGATACATVESISTQIRQESADVEIQIVGDALASRLRAGISSLIGQQVPDGGRYLVAHAPGTLTSYVVRLEGGCATHHGRFPQELVRLWLDGSPA